MTILAIETSCDETAAAVVQKNPEESSVRVLSNVIASSLSYHAQTGGIIPNVAAREQLKFIIPVIETAIKDAFSSRHSGEHSDSRIGFWTSQNDIINNIDAIAVTYGPGLIGSLLIGVETARTLSYLWKKPIIPVNHLLGHIYANWLIANSVSRIEAPSAISHTPSAIKFPALALLVSGGHTDLVLINNHNEFKWLGGTLDDAAGEAFDKIGRLLNLPYPAGSTMEAFAKVGNEKNFTFPRPMIGSKDFNFSFSGLKAAAMREVKKLQNGVAKEEGRPDNAQRSEHWREGLLLTGPQLSKTVIADISASIQKSIVGVLVRKTMKAAEKYNVKSLLLGGGVASNEMLRKTLEVNCNELGVKFFVPEKKFCTDNAAMIGAYAAFHPEKLSWEKITANPELYFE